MAPLNSGVSVYHRSQALYWRTSEGTLIATEGRCSQQTQQQWPVIWQELSHTLPQSTTSQLQSGTVVTTSTIEAPCLECSENCACGSHHTLRVRELPNRHKSLTLGLITRIDTPTPATASAAIDDWAETFFLLQTRFKPFQSISHPNATNAARTIAQNIADLFDETLRNVPNGDEWITGGGRGYFANRVYGFVSEARPVEFGLPAFPCKSSNGKKVGGVDPDAAEFLALGVLRGFLAEVERIYAPGAVLWVISDGHVFADCIGVDDSVVTAYDEKLKAAYYEAHRSSTGNTSIRFVGLEEILFSNSEANSLLPREWLDAFEVVHPIETELTAKAELSRKTLMATCQIDRDNFRSLITKQDPHALQFYRGQSRFMFEDLSHPGFLEMSSSKRKKLASKVAAEMIARNQAYSNLIELLFPNHIRFSIHAHPNRGPKFGIRLFPRNKVRAISSLSDLSEPQLAYDFQLPTPWHNSIMKLHGDDNTVYLGKSEIFREALRSGKYEGAWVDGPDGGFFQLRSTDVVPQAAPAAVTGTTLATATPNTACAVAAASQEASAVTDTSKPILALEKVGLVSKSLRVAAAGHAPFSFDFPMAAFKISAVLRAVRKMLSLLVRG